MSFPKALISLSFTLACILFLHAPLGSSPQPLSAPAPLPHVSLKMENPAFWTRKLGNPSQILMKPERIEKMNEGNLKRQDLYLFKVKELKEEWPREELLALLQEDWDGFRTAGKTWCGKGGYPLEEPFWNELRANLNRDALKERNQVFWGLIVKRTDIRFFPTDEWALTTPSGDPFDRFQHSSLSPGSLIGIYSISKDQLWAYVQTGFIRGWVHKDAVAIAKEKSEAVEYEEAKDRLVITGNFVKVFGDPFFQREVFSGQMGTSFPIVGLPCTSTVQSPQGDPGMSGPYHMIKIPLREMDGTLTFGKGYIPKGEDVHRGFLPYTQKNAAQQAFKMLRQPYGWGEMSGGRDCSRLIMDLFATFGIRFPRNSMHQARIGIALGHVEGKTIKEKRRILDQAIPLATTLRLPGHIMLYLGKHNGRYYVIHSLWGVQGKGRSGPAYEKIGRAVVSDLSLGESGPNGSLLQRITDIRYVGEEDGKIGITR